MKKLFILIFICLLKLNGMAQMSSCSSPKLLLQANLRTDGVLWYEAGALYLGKKYLNVQVKASFRNDYSYKPSNSTINTTYKGSSINGNIGTVNFNSSYSYIKPGFILLRSNRKLKTILLGVNGVFGLSKNTVQVDFTDPLIGPTSEFYKEDKFHTGMELECRFLLDLNSHMAISLAATFVDEFTKEALFKDVWAGTFSKHYFYSPGMGYNGSGFMFLSSGLVVKLY